MTRKLLPSLCLVLFCGTVSLAQNPDYPKVDFAAGYSLNNLDTSAGRHNLNGFTAAVAWNFRKWIALEGDVTYTTGTVLGESTNLFTYLAGPRFTHRSGKFEPFVHTLFGGGHLNFGALSTNGWAGKFGGGLDIVAGRHVAVRVGEIDYYRYHGHVDVGNQRLNNALFTFGVRIF